MKAWKMILSLAVALAFCAPSMAQDEKKKDQGKRPQPTAEEAFKAMDGDKDGKVTKDELKKWAESNTRMAKQLERDPETVNKMFDRMDGDKDGKVTLDEYKKYREDAASRRKKKDPS